MELRDYQQEVIDRLDATLSETNRVILGLATGAGKTFIAAHIAKRAVDDGHKVLFVVHLKTLVGQAVRHFHALGLRVGILRGEDTSYSREDDIIVASIQTIRTRSAPDWVRLVIVDECHVLHTEHCNLMERWNRLPFIGLSATPLRKGLGAWFGALVKGPSIQELTERGHLVPTVAYAPGGEAALEILNGVPVVGGDFKETELRVALKNDHLFGDPVQTFRDKAEGRQAICFAINKAHSRELAEAFNVAGIPAAHIDDRTPEETRKEMFDDFRDRKLRVLCSVGVLSIGFDMPQASCVILCRPTLSEMLHIQQLGRGLRPDNGKHDCLVLDHSGNTLRFGLPHHFELPDTLDEYDEGTTRARKKKRTLQSCYACGHVLEPKDEFCPQCGTDRPRKSADVAYKAGDLVAYGGFESGDHTMKDFYLEVRGLVEAEGKGAENACKTAYAMTVHKFKDRKVPFAWRDLEPKEPSIAVIKYVKSRRIAWRKRHAA